ncbi:MAG: hypothetical protein RLZZ337_1032 [Bacteroidota bacterium]|jgi:hypothetical protein
MNHFLDTIWNETDPEKRFYLWKYYLQQTDLSLKNLQLLPRYREVVNHKNECDRYIEFVNTFDLRNQRITGINELQSTFTYDNPLASDEIKHRVNEVQSEYLPQLSKRVNAFQDLKSFLYNVVNLEPIGIEQAYHKEGYLFVRNTDSTQVNTYSYFISSYVNSKARSIVKLTDLGSFNYSISYGFDQYKKSLNSKNKHYLNCYAVHSQMPLPWNDTLLPIAKGKLSKYLETFPT